MRILPLHAAATEIVCALGFREQMVGRSHECDFPPDVAELPAVTEPRFDTAGSSRAIDADVRSLLVKSLVEDALGVYRVFPEKLRELRPTHIVTQTQCLACSVSLRDVEAAAAEAAGCEAAVVSLEPHSLADVWADFMRAASALGATEAGVKLVAEAQKRMAAVEAKTRAAARPPAVAGIEWADPLMAWGNWMPELTRMAGGRNLFGKAGAHAPGLDYEQLTAADPDVLVLSLCGFGIERARQDLALLEARPDWRALRAVRRGQVFLVDGNRFFNRPGPRLVESLEILAEILHPQLFSFGREGCAWQRAART